MEAALQTIPRTAEEALPAPVGDRLARIAWLIARSHCVRLDDVLDGPGSDPATANARAVAIALGGSLMRSEPRDLARYFRVPQSAIESTCRDIAERAARDAQFRTTLNFLRSSCARALE